MRKKNRFLTALVANRQGEIYDLEGYAAAGMAGNQLVPLELENTVDLPFGGGSQVEVERSLELACHGIGLLAPEGVVFAEE